MRNKKLLDVYNQILLDLKPVKGLRLYERNDGFIVSFRNEARIPVEEFVILAKKLLNNVYSEKASTLIEKYECSLETYIFVPKRWGYEVKSIDSISSESLAITTTDFQKNTIKLSEVEEVKIVVKIDVFYNKQLLDVFRDLTSLIPRFQPEKTSCLNENNAYINLYQKRRQLYELSDEDFTTSIKNFLKKIKSPRFCERLKTNNILKEIIVYSTFEIDTKVKSVLSIENNYIEFLNFNNSVTRVELNNITGISLFLQVDDKIKSYINVETYVCESTTKMIKINEKNIDSIKSAIESSNEYSLTRDEFFTKCEAYEKFIPQLNVDKIKVNEDNYALVEITEIYKKTYDCEGCVSSKELEAETQIVESY